MSTSFLRDLVREVNDLRRNPCAYADKIERNKKYFKADNVWKHPKSKFAIKTEEGAAAYDEAINFLKNKATSRNELDVSKSLTKIAEDFLKEYQKDPMANIPLDDVVKKYGKFTGLFRRLVQLGADTPEFVVVSLVVGDGDKSRQYRDALLAENLNKIGVAHGEHKDYSVISVLTICNDFTNADGSNDNMTY